MNKAAINSSSLHMLIGSTFRKTRMNCKLIISLAQNPNFQLKNLSSFSSHSLNPKHFSRIFVQYPPPMAPSSVKIIAEYAKSNKSKCKNCSKTILVKTLRLGFVSRDGRGFDMTRWFHPDCASFGSDPVCSAEEINGFELLEAC